MLSFLRMLVAIAAQFYFLQVYLEKFFKLIRRLWNCLWNNTNFQYNHKFHLWELNDTPKNPTISKVIPFAQS